MRQEKLAQLLDISIGRTPSRNEQRYWGPGHKWVSIRDLNSKIITETKEQITDLAVKETRCKIVRKGTLLFSFKLTIGKMAFAGCDLFTNEAIAAFPIKDEKKLNSEFLYFALQSATFGGSNQAVMGKTLNSKSLAEIEIPLPPLDDQIRIAHLLGKVEGLIAQRKQHLQQLDDLLKSVFLEMFGDPLRNEKEWSTIGWDALFSTRTGKLNANAMSEAGEYPFFTCAKEIYKIDYFAFDCEALILAGNNATADYDVKYFKGKFNAYQRTYILELKDKTDNYRFYQYHLELKLLQLKDGSKGANTKYLTKQFLDTLIFINPDKASQREFANIVEKVAGIKTHYQQSLTDHEALYGALSQQAFKGELDLSRVPLPRQSVATPDLTKQANMEPTTPTSFQLPDPEDYDWLVVENRPKLIEFWLAAWCGRYAEESFAASKFMDAAYQRLVELFAQDTFQFDKPGKGFDEARWYEEPAPFGINEYEQIKKWVFDALVSGKITQGFDDAGNRIQLKAGQA